MRKQITPLTLGPIDLLLVAQLNAIGPKSWDSPTQTIIGVDVTAQRDDLKDRIRAHLYQIQEEHCAYCTADLAGTEIDIDHIAKKSTFTLLTWETQNLLAVCTACNIRRKGNRNFVTNQNSVVPSAVANSNSLQFEIVHPILVNPQNHIKWCKDLIFCQGHHTPEGEFTINFFKLNSPASTINRCGTLVRQSMGTTIDEPFIQDIVSRARSRKT